jgi:hypothetical protein
LKLSFLSKSIPLFRLADDFGYSFKAIGNAGSDLTRRVGLRMECLKNGMLLSRLKMHVPILEVANRPGEPRDNKFCRQVVNDFLVGVYN